MIHAVGVQQVRFLYISVHQWCAGAGLRELVLGIFLPNFTSSDNVLVAMIGVCIPQK